jgi:hypothetical protein
MFFFVDERIYPNGTWLADPKTTDWAISHYCDHDGASLLDAQPGDQFITAEVRDTPYFKNIEIIAAANMRDSSHMVFTGWRQTDGQAHGLLRGAPADIAALLTVAACNITADTIEAYTRFCLSFTGHPVAPFSHIADHYQPLTTLTDLPALTPTGLMLKMVIESACTPLRIQAREDNWQVAGHFAFHTDLYAMIYECAPHAAPRIVESKKLHKDVFFGAKDHSH